MSRAHRYPDAHQSFEDAALGYSFVRNCEARALSGRPFLWSKSRGGNRARTSRVPGKVRAPRCLMPRSVFPLMWTCRRPLGCAMSATPDPRSSAGARARALSISMRRAGGSRTPTRLKRIRSLVIPPAWTRCLDLRLGERAHSGDRPRRQRAQAIQVSRRISRGARAIEIRALVRVRCGAADDPGDSRRAHEPARTAAREGSGDGRASLGDDADPRRQRRICAKQSELWTDHAQKRSRRGRGLRSSFPVHGQERQAMVARHAGSARRADHSGLPGAAGSGSSAIFQ